MARRDEQVGKAPLSYEMYFRLQYLCTEVLRTTCHRIAYLLCEIP